jgi:hypothetical protein
VFSRMLLSCCSRRKSKFTFPKRAFWRNFCNNLMTAEFR